MLSTERGYGKAKKPDDYLKEFTAFINSHRNDIPALLTVLTRPRELTRKQLRELALELDRAGYSEVNLATAWREKRQWLHLLKQFAVALRYGQHDADLHVQATTALSR